MLEDADQKESVFFSSNRILPWIQVTAMRYKEKDDCEQSDDTRIIQPQCYETLSSQILNQTEFDGAPYGEYATDYFRTKYNGQMTNKGNKKDLKIFDEDGKPIWGHVLSQNIFRYFYDMP